MKNKPQISSEENACVSNDPVFWEYFVRHTPGYSTANRNVSKGFVNGTRLRYYSLLLNVN